MYPIYNSKRNIFDYLSNRRRQQSLTHPTVRCEERQPLVADINGDIDAAGPIPISGSQSRIRKEKKYDASTLQTEETIQSEKREEILALEGELSEARDLMQLLTAQVREQQEGLNQVSQNVTVATENVVNATDELKVARRYQQKARKRGCCLVCIFITILLAGVIVLALVEG